MFNFSSFLELSITSQTSDVQSHSGNSPLCRSAQGLFDFAAQLTGCTSGYIIIPSREGKKNLFFLFDSSKEFPLTTYSSDSDNSDLFQSITHGVAVSKEGDRTVSTGWDHLISDGTIEKKNSLTLPLVFNGTSQGMLGLIKNKSTFTQTEREQVESLAKLASTVLDNALDNEILEGKLRNHEQKNKKETQLVPICAQCKSVRDHEGTWDSIETYLAKHSKIVLSHGLCECCARDLYGDEEFDECMREEDDAF